MRRTTLLVLLFVLTSPTLAADLQPGLLGEYFNLGKDLGEIDEPPGDMKPLYLRIDKQINFKEAGGEFHGSKLADHFLVRWTGVIRIDTPGEYTFSTVCDTPGDP